MRVKPRGLALLHMPLQYRGKIGEVSSCQYDVESIRNLLVWRVEHLDYGPGSYATYKTLKDLVVDFPNTILVLGQRIHYLDGTPSDYLPVVAVKRGTRHESRN